MKSIKIIMVALLILVAAIGLNATIGDPTQFGNSTNTTCTLGGNTGTATCKTDFCITGGACLSTASSDGLPKDQSVNTTSDVEFQNITDVHNIINVSCITFVSGGQACTGS